MIIVSGHLVVDATHRAAYLQDCLDVIVSARRAPGCRDFHLAADPLDPQRINVYEEWTSVEALEAFRGHGHDGPGNELIHAAQVAQHVIASTQQL